MAYKRAPVWAGSVVGMMFIYGVTQVDLAKRIGWTPRYLSMVLHGDRAPKNAEKRVNAALNEAIREKISDKIAKDALRNFDLCRED